MTPHVITAAAESMLAITRDALYGWTAERLTARQTERGAPAYLYLFDHGYPAADQVGLHAFHAAEIPYVVGTADRTPQFWVMRPIDGKAATVGNGVTVAFEATDRAAVDALHARALEAGATDEGAPGLRPHYHADYYGAYLRDPDGNKLCIVCHRA